MKTLVIAVLDDDTDGSTGRDDPINLEDPRLKVVNIIPHPWMVVRLRTLRRMGPNMCQCSSSTRGFNVMVIVTRMTMNNRTTGRLSSKLAHGSVRCTENREFRESPFYVIQAGRIRWRRKSGIKIVVYEGKARRVASAERRVNVKRRFSNKSQAVAQTAKFIGEDFRQCLPRGSYSVSV